MKLRRIALHNYRAFQHEELAFPEGITAIIGNNGTGKSTIIEAVGWALYGNRVARTTKEDIKRQGAAPNDECYVTLTFTLGDDDYEVTRIMTGSSLSTDATVKVNGLVAASSASGATELMEKKLGMDHDAFFTSLVARQKEINALSSKTPGERKRSMLRMLNIDAIEEAVKQVRQDKRNTRQLVEAMRSALKDLDELQEQREQQRTAKEEIDDQLKEVNSVLSSLTSRVSQLREQRQAEQQKLERYNELQNQRSTTKERLQSKRQQHEQKQEERQELQRKKQHLEELQPKEERYQDLKEQKETMEEQRERHRTRQQLEDDVTEIKDDIEGLQETASSLRQELEDREGVEKRLEEVNQQLEDVAEHKNEAASSRKVTDTKLASAKEKLEEMQQHHETIEEQGADSDCPTCGRPLGDHYEEILHDYEEKAATLRDTVHSLEQQKKEVGDQLGQLNQRQQRLTETKGKLEQQHEQLKQKKQRYDHIEEQLAEQQQKLQEKQQRIEALGRVTFDEEGYHRVADEIQELESTREKIIGLRSQVKRLDDVTEQLQQLQKDMEEARHGLQQLNEDIDALDFDRERYEQLEEAYEQKREQLQEMREKRIQLTARQDQAASQLERLAEEIAEQKEQREEIQKHRREIRQLERLAGPRDSGLLNEFKHYLISRIGPMLSHYASHFFTVFTAGKYSQIEVDDNYEIYIYDDGEQFGIERFSGGEEDLANLSLRLAISQVIAERAGGVDFHFIVLDEIFGSQDRERRINVLNTLGELSNQFQQVLLITHIEEIKDSMEHVIRTYEDEQGISHLDVE